MAEPHAHSQPIQTYGPAPHNRNIWPHNSRAPPSRLADSFVLQVVVYPLLTENETNRQRETENETNRQRETENETNRQRETENETNRQRGTENETNRQRETENETNRQRGTENETN